MHPHVQEVADLTRQYTKALQDLSDLHDQYVDLMADYKRIDVNPPPGTFAALKYRIQRAQELKDGLFFALQTLSQAIAKQNGGAQ